MKLGNKFDSYKIEQYLYKKLSILEREIYINYLSNKS